MIWSGKGLRDAVSYLFSVIGWTILPYGELSLQCLNVVVIS